MVQKIQYSDNLKEGTDKLNQSIDQSNDAILQSKNADQKSTQALNNSVSTQTQLDNIVVEGDSSVEAAQARVDSAGTSHPTLKSRLDNFEVSATAQLQQVENNQINPYKIGLDGKSSEDVGELMQQFLNKSLNAGIKKVVFPKGDYILSRPLNANVDDLEIDFQGSTLKWRGTTDLNNSNLRAQGVVNVHGIIGTATNVTEFIPKEELFNVSLDSDSFYSSTLACKVKTDNNALFAVGDYVILAVNTGTNTVNTLLPMAEVICEVLDITPDGYIVLDYYSPFDWSGKTVVGTVKKITARKNVVVKNLFIDDEVVVSPTYKTDGQRNALVSGVSFLYTKGCKAENIRGNNTKFPLVINRYSHSFSQKNIKTDRPAIWEGGEGYTSQFIFCNKVVGENISGVRERHTVDISGGAFYHFKNVISHRPKFIPIDMHGICEHSIVWENCVGHAIMCNGIADFPCLVDNVKYINHKGAITCGGTDSYASNIKIVNSDVSLTNYHALTTAIENSKVVWNTASSNYDLFPNRRGSLEKTFFKVFGGSLDLFGTGGITTLKAYYDYFLLRDCKVTSKLNIPSTSKTVLSFFDNDAVHLINCDFNDVDSFIFNETTAKDLSIKIKDNIYNYTIDKSGRSIIEIGTMTGRNVFVEFDDNKSHYKTANYLSLILLSESAGNFGNANFYITGKGNKFIGDLAASIKMFLTAPTGEQTYKLNHLMLQNIFKNYQGTTLDVTYNKII